MRPASAAAPNATTLPVIGRTQFVARAPTPPARLPRMRWAITGGAGFLGLHLARRLLTDGHEVRTLDLAPLDDAQLERDVEELRGDVRDAADGARLAERADVLVHAAAALPIQASRES